MPQLGHHVRQVGEAEEHGAFADGRSRQSTHLLDAVAGNDGDNDAHQDRAKAKSAELKSDLKGAGRRDLLILPAIVDHSVEKNDGDGVVCDALAEDKREQLGLLRIVDQ